MYIWLQVRCNFKYKQSQLNKVILLLLFLSVGSLKAQNTSYEFWPEADIWYRLNPSWRVSGLVPLTKYNESNTRDLNVYLQLDYAWGKTKHPFNFQLIDDMKAQQLKAWMLRGGVMKGSSLYDLGDSYNEEMIYAELHHRVPFKGNLLLTHRLRPESRWLGSNGTNSARYRYRLMLEKEFEYKNWSIIPYLNAEVYWDSRYSSFSRLRCMAASSFSPIPKIALETNLTYQYDVHYATKNLFAFNLVFHFFFERNTSKK